MPTLHDLHLPPRTAGKRGKTPARHSPLPDLALYLKADAAQQLDAVPPEGYDYAHLVSGGFPMCLNDQLGCCVIAGAWHYRQLVWAVLGRQLPYCGDDTILRQYEHSAGYVPGDPATDNGCNELDVIHQWMTEGLFDGQSKAVAAATLHPNDLQTHRFAAYNVGSALLGWDLPAYAESEFANHQPWGLEAGNGTPVGGHCTVTSGWGQLTAGGTTATWGSTEGFTDNFARYYLEEVHVVILEEHVEAGHGALANVEVEALIAACAAWTQEDE